jgi:4-hydroxybenzoyl-CoA thioesterase
LGTPFQSVHRVRFEEIDAAGIVYFARFFTWCHDAMAAMLEPLDGGYVALVRGRNLGFPAVHVEADYVSPLRFGDEVRIAIHVERAGRSSVAMRFELTRGDDGRKVATVRHVMVLTDLTVLKSAPLPEDVRAVFERHMSPSPPPVLPPVSRGGSD